MLTFKTIQSTKHKGEQLGRNQEVNTQSVVCGSNVRSTNKAPCHVKYLYVTYKGPVFAF
jgi:hypothetical protein